MIGTISLYALGKGLATEFHDNPTTQPPRPADRRSAANRCQPVRAVTQGSRRTIGAESHQKLSR